MLKQLPLLVENPPFVLAPNIGLTQDSIALMIKEREKESLSDCDNCGKVLSTPYYVSIGIPPSPLIIETYQCKSLNYEENMEFKNIISEIQSVAKRFNIDSKYQWVFSEQNIMRSKTRICGDCQQKYKWGRWRGLEMPTINIQCICFAVEEYQRLHTPICAAKSDYERYILSLPDRSNASWQHFGEVDLNSDFGEIYFETDMEEYLTIALISDYKPSDPLSQEFQTNYIQDKNRMIPNDQELTRWMQKQINDHYDLNDCYKDWYRIQFCKIFENPKTLKYPIYRDGKEVYNTRYSVIVHYSVPKGGWHEYDI